MQGIAISHDGTCIAYEAKGSGPALLLLHGLAGEGQDWHDKGYVTRLTVLGRRVITLDTRGHGKSSKPHHASDYADYKRAQDVAAVLDALGIQRADLHGYAMGGWIAMDTARCFPRRVRSLSLNGAHGFAQSLQGFRDSLRDGLDGWICQLEDQYGRPLNPNRRKKILKNDIKALRASLQMARPDVTRDLRGLGIPALVLAGEHEGAFGDIKRFAAAIPARFEMLPGKSHVTAFSAVNEVCGAITTFLEEIENGQFSPLLAAGGAWVSR
jgi:pimeloyl-ACP methyl ester carboxylesterase